MLCSITPSHVDFSDISSSHPGSRRNQGKTAPYPDTDILFPLYLHSIQFGDQYPREVMEYTSPTMTTSPSYHQANNTGATTTSPGSWHNPPNPNPNKQPGPVAVRAPRCQRCQATLAVLHTRSCGMQVYCNNTPCLCAIPSTTSGSTCSCSIEYQGSIDTLPSGSYNPISPCLGLDAGHPYLFTTRAPYGRPMITPEHLSAMQSLFARPLTHSGMRTQAEIGRDTQYAGAQFDGVMPPSTPSPDILSEDLQVIQHPAHYQSQSSHQFRRREDGHGRSGHRRSSRR
ncbi:hypothetical protein F5Y16DRAFT_213316 [Xylariaceae sp. FL0255]|nr:hypothetical protein F5Y16DRAFT_213316 [Xylariaceae sp. FL0255]